MKRQNKEEYLKECIYSNINKNLKKIKKNMKQQKNVQINFLEMIELVNLI